MDFGIILKMLIMACGVYMIYWAVQMKTTHQIPQMLVGKGFPTDRAKDPEGFMKATFPLTMGMGIILLAVGLTGALEVFGAYPIVDTILTLLMLAALVFYGMFLLKAQKRYLIGLDDNNKKFIKRERIQKYDR